MQLLIDNLCCPHEIRLNTLTKDGKTCSS